VEEEGFCAMVVGTLALDLRLEPNPRPLKREFIELIRPERCNQCERWKDEYGEESCVGVQTAVSTLLAASPYSLAK
jgi:hypothetical protein